ncbi:GntR family transcriptional regulator [Lederbergia lenta]|uniref:GntR family transcriptional regulator n=1 Tax=Lederbergia lenta TaxID=1467 RepID=A0A2X4VK98_LEDLE|nr:GntR family transcriptional regulator [Lederbergia lenta]MCM3113272.1 GntR family transcriptional regulator [Lederbergia lenta]MEC2326384.1 GntR family transcriptional regulator [Lederbergia lenta]SQI51383.1 GntR family transcriptional regulator [Lederbergia lenta]
MIDKSSPIPIYYQLEEHIKKLIEKGDLNPGDSLPSEREYGEIYGISRMTVRQAITNLVNERILYRVKGKGTFVMEQKLEQKLQGLTSFSEDMKVRGMKAGVKLLSFDIIPADNDIAEQLGINEQDLIYEIKRIRLAEGIPMALERTYISADRVQGLNEEIVKHSLYEFIENTLKLKISGGVQIIEAAIANEEEVEHLQIPKNSPILLMQRTTTLENKVSFEVVKSSYRADRYKFMIDLKRF